MTPGFAHSALSAGRRCGKCEKFEGNSPKGLRCSIECVEYGLLLEFSAWRVYANMSLALTIQGL